MGYPGTTTEALVERAAAVGAEIAKHAERHDRDGTFVDEGMQAVREAGLLAIAVPEELGGSGATPRQVAAVQRELAHHCGSTALATSMHQHVTSFIAWRHRRGMPGGEPILRLIAESGVVLVSTGGADFTHPKGEATKVDGGYRVSGHKIFCSQSPAGAAFSTMFRYEDPEQGLRVLNMAVPIGEGITVLDNWDTLGMRGTGSNDVVFDDVFVPEERVSANRPFGVLDPPLMVIMQVAIPIISGVYLGIAESAYEAALEVAATKADSPTVQRQVGLMSMRLRAASWALDRAFDEIGDDPNPAPDPASAALVAKREVTLAGLEVCDLAMEVAGGASYFKGSVIERCYRDIRAIKFHPLPPEPSLLFEGRRVLGQPVDPV